MKLKDVSAQEMEFLEQLRQVFISHGYAVPLSSIKQKAEFAKQELLIGQTEQRLSQAVQHLTALGILFKHPLNGVSDSNIFDLTEKGRSTLTLAQMKAREIEDEKGLTNAQKDQRRTNRINRTSAIISLFLSLIAIAVAIWKPC